MSEGEPATKRLKTMTDTIVDVHAEGDTLLVVKGFAGIDKSISMRVSSHALCIGSTVFKQLLADLPSSDSPKTLHLLDDDGDSVFFLCNILHLRNDALPPRLQPTALLAFVRTAIKYNATVAASRSTTPWLDDIYHSKTLQYSDPILIFKMLEAAYLLNDAVYFVRFSTRWVLQQTLGGQTVDRIAAPEGSQDRRRLAAELIARQKDCINTLKADLDIIVDSCAEGLADDNKHYVDCAPGADPTPEDLQEADDDGEIEICTVDKDGATRYLCALRDSNMWPATRWPNSLSAIAKIFENFSIPKLDSAGDECHWCIEIKIKFATAVGIVKQMHQERLWGLCLDCYKNGGLYEGECRYEHSKAKNVSADVVARHLSMSTQNIKDGQMV